MKKHMKGMRGEIGEIDPAEFLQAGDEILGRPGSLCGKNICRKFIAS